MPPNKIDIPNETLEQMVERYRVLSNPQFVNYIMKQVTIDADTELKFRLENLPTHPKDTGLMKKSWVLPEQYLRTHFGKVWQVYLNNTATVGAQAQLKDAQVGRIHIKKKRIGRHNLKRYMPWVDKRTKFYTKQLRVMKNKIKSIFKEDIVFALGKLYRLRPEVFTNDEIKSLNMDGVS